MGGRRAGTPRCDASSSSATGGIEHDGAALAAELTILHELHPDDPDDVIRELQSAGLVKAERLEAERPQGGVSENEAV